MNVTILAIIKTIVEYAKYVVTYKILCSFPMKRKIPLVIGWTFLTCMVQVVFHSVENSSALTTIIIMIMGLGIPLICLNESVKYRICSYLAIVPSISILDMLVSYIIWVLFDVKFSYALNNDIYMLYGSIMTFVVIFISCLLCRRAKLSIAALNFTVYQYIIIFSGILCCFFLLSGAQYIILGMYMTEKGRTYSILAITFASTMYVILSIWQSITMSKQTYYKNKNAFYEEHIHLQEQHIRTVIENDKAMRSFRHDMQAHLTVMMEYCREKDYEKLEAYLVDVKENSGLYQKVTYTGNSAIDAVISELLKSAKEKHVKINWKGTIPDKIEISIYDLCTIFSNLIKNAIEACEKFEEDDKKNVDVNVYPYESKLFIQVCNPVKEHPNVVDNKIETTKSNKALHGFGTYNIEIVAKKYGGNVTYTAENHLFLAEVLL